MGRQLEDTPSHFHEAPRIGLGDRNPHRNPTDLFLGVEMPSYEKSLQNLEGDRAKSISPRSPGIAVIQATLAGGASRRLRLSALTTSSA